MNLLTRIVLLLIVFITVAAAAFAGEPTISDLTITPSTLKTATDATGNGTGSDAEGAWAFGYIWYVNSSSVKSGLYSANTTTQDAEAAYTYTGVKSVANFLDENESTYSSMATDTGELYINYTSPGLLAGVVWEMTTGASTGNVTLPSTCSNQTPLQLKINITYDSLAVTHDLTQQCYNGTGYETVRTDTSSNLYEEKVYLVLPYYGYSGSTAIDTLLSTNFAEADNVTFSARTWDGYNWSNYSNSSVYTVANTAPVTSGAVVNSTSSIGDDPIQVWCQGSDADTADSVYYQWLLYKNGALLINNTVTSLQENSTNRTSGSDNAFDGNYSTWASIGSTPVYLNYSIPLSATSSTTWSRLDEYGSGNITLTSCDFTGTYLQLRVYKTGVDQSRYQCYNSTDWVTVHTDGASGFILYEEAIYWKYVEGTNANVYNLSADNATYGDSFYAVCTAHDYTEAASTSNTSTTLSLDLGTGSGGGGGGGGGGTTVIDLNSQKKDCDIDVLPSTIYISRIRNSVEVTLKNNELESYSPTFSFSGDDSTAGNLFIANQIATLLPGESDSFGVRYDNNILTDGTATLTLKSANCKDIPIEVFVSLQDSQALFAGLFDDGFDLVDVLKEPVLAAGHPLREETPAFSFGAVALVALVLYFALFVGRIAESFRNGSYWVTLLWVFFLFVVVFVTTVFVVTGVRVVT